MRTFGYQEDEVGVARPRASFELQRQHARTKRRDPFSVSPDHRECSTRPAVDMFADCIQDHIQLWESRGLNEEELERLDEALQMLRQETERALRVSKPRRSCRKRSRAAGVSTLSQERPKKRAHHRPSRSLFVDSDEETEGNEGEDDAPSLDNSPLQQPPTPFYPSSSDAEDSPPLPGTVHPEVGLASSAVETFRTQAGPTHPAEQRLTGEESGTDDHSESGYVTDPGDADATSRVQRRGSYRSCGSDYTPSSSEWSGKDARKDSGFSPGQSTSWRTSTRQNLPVSRRASDVAIREGQDLPKSPIKGSSDTGSPDPDIAMEDHAAVEERNITWQDILHDSDAPSPRFFDTTYEERYPDGRSCTSTSSSPMPAPDVFDAAPDASASGSLRRQRSIEVLREAPEEQEKFDAEIERCLQLAVDAHPHFALPQEDQPVESQEEILTLLRPLGYCDRGPISSRTVHAVLYNLLPGPIDYYELPDAEQETQFLDQVDDLRCNFVAIVGDPDPALAVGTAERRSITVLATRPERFAKLIEARAPSWTCCARDVGVSIRDWTTLTCGS